MLNHTVGKIDVSDGVVFFSVVIGDSDGAL